MNSIQKYVLNSLFVRNQITEEKLAQALDTFSKYRRIRQRDYRKHRKTV